MGSYISRRNRKIPEREVERGFISIEFIDKKSTQEINNSEEEATEGENVVEQTDVRIETIEKYIKRGKKVMAIWIKIFVYSLGEIKNVLR